ncbi:hypothetical protein [Muricoccus radiodurans]|uniref:hypothetical protein n=1 Tax=Muricoccus radiodurans TaxID=2231721 RepID=UPI003CF15248
MPLCLVVHDLAQPGAEVLEAAVWELSESHWMVGTSMAVATGVSPEYLADHLRRALRRAGLDGMLLAVGLTGDMALDGLPGEGRRWMQEQAQPQN